MFYKQLVGSIMYLTTTRPDISYEMSYISRFSESPKECHWKVGKRMLRYIAGITNHCLWYTASTGSTLVGYTDSDFASDTHDRKSTYRYVFSIWKEFDFMGIQEAIHSFYIFHRNRICQFC